MMIVGFGSLFMWGLNSSCYRLYFKYKDDPEALKDMLSTNLITIIISILIYGVILAMIYPLLNSFFFHGKLDAIWVVLAFAQYLFMNLNTINQQILQAGHQGKKWAINESAAFTLQIILQLTLIVTRIFTFQAIIIAALAAELIKFVLIYKGIGRQGYRIAFNVNKLKESLKYSWPTIPTTIIVYGYSYLDRVLVSRLYGLFQVGYLEMSTKISLIMKMAMDGIDGVLSPINLGLIGEGTDASLEKMAKLNLKAMYVLLFIAGLIIMSIKELVIILTTKQYYSVMYIAPLYVYYHAFGILGMPSYWLIYHRTDKMFIKIIMNILFLGCSIVLNVMLIPKYGIYGAALAIFSSSAITQFIQFIVGLKITPIPLDKTKILVLFLSLFLQTAIVYTLYYIEMPLFGDILIKVILAGLFIWLGRALRIFTWQEAGSLLDDIRGRISNKLLRNS
jgi:O-antigen/teichoic acid export membrane protein